MTTIPVGNPRERLPLPSKPGGVPWFVGVCLAVIAVSLVAVLYLQFDFSPSAAGLTGTGFLILIALAAFSGSRSRERRAVEAELLETRRTAANLQREIAALGARFAETEQWLLQAVEEAVDVRTAALTADLQVIEDTVRDILNDGLAAQQIGNTSLQRDPFVSSPPISTSRDGEGIFRAGNDFEASAVLRRAVEESRIDVFLQPVVTLPQRRVRYYEALTRLRGDDGETIMPDTYIPVAEPAGLLPLIDDVLLFRCMQIVHRLGGRNRDLGIFCNISSKWVGDDERFAQFLGFMQDKGELARSLILELPQAVFENTGPIEQARLESLSEQGLRLSVDHVEHLDIDGAAYARRHVRFVKIDSSMLLNTPKAAGANIHVSDLARLLARSGIELIATKIETEAELVDLLDYDIQLGQGHLFSPPRPVRGEFVGERTGGADWSRAS